MKAGVHTSVRHGFVRALTDAVSLGCDTFQIFTHAPSDWRTRVPEESEFTNFRAAREKSGLTPVVAHSPYLPSLGSSNPDLYRKSLEALKDDLTRCEKLGADFLVIHPGNYSPNATPEIGFDRIADAINEAFAAVPGATVLLIENMAGGGRRLGGTFREIAEIRNRIGDKDRLAMCFDTCHALAAGYDISTEDGVAATVRELDKAVGLDFVRVFHVNDSRGALGSQRDMHEHLGQGKIGLTGLGHLFRTPAFRNCAFILETPKQPAPTADLENLARLRSCF